MIQWISAHSGDLIVILALAAIAGGIVVNMVRNKGKSCGSCKGCNGNCGCCGMEHE